MVNEHNWILAEGRGNGKCAHGVLEDDRQKPLLVKNSPAHYSLRKVLLNKIFLNKLPYFLLFICRLTCKCGNTVHVVNVK